LDILNIIFIFVKIKIAMADFNIDKVVCLNLKTMDLKQIFSISETYSWDFEVLLNDKNTGSNKLYVETTTGEVIGMEEQLMCKYTNKLHDPQFMVFSKFSPVTKKIYDRLKNMKPVKVPKVPKTERSLNTYLYLLEKGFNIRMVSFDRYIEYLRNKKQENLVENTDQFLNEDLSKLSKKDIQSLIDDALDRRDYVEVERIIKFQK
jgi:hypothetical protein